MKPVSYTHLLEEILKAVFGNRAVDLLCAAALGEERCV